MRNIKQILFVPVCVMSLVYGACAVELPGTAAVNVTSDTASDAKNIAMAQARRKIINQVLSQYANETLVQVAVKNAKNADLMNLISSSSIDGEKQSDTTYAANITMFVDSDAAREWLNSNNIQNWLPGNAVNHVSGSQIQVTMSDRVGNWMDLQRMARDVGVNVNTKFIMGNQATIEVPAGKLSVFLNALRGHGWGYSNQAGVIKIWR